LPDLFQVPTDEVGRAQVLKAPIGKWFGLQVAPEAAMNVSRFYARILKGLQASREVVSLEKRETGLAVKNAVGTKDRNPGIVDMRCK
jgi:hypothetical protein